MDGRNAWLSMNLIASVLLTLVKLSPTVYWIQVNSYETPNVGTMATDFLAEQGTD